ncbi:cyclic nucleotide-binding/CBS domain-containing protein [Thermodesulfobacteriota bacterium]
MKLREFMATRIEFIDGDAPVYDAIEKMVDRRIRSLLVEFPGKGLNRGVITARDVIFKVLAKGVDPNQIKVSEIASTPIICVEPDLDFKQAAVLMEESNIERVFVCEAGKIIGVVALLDVMAATLVMRAKEGYASS